MERRGVLILVLLAACEPSEPGVIRVRVNEDGTYSPRAPFPRHARLVIDAPLDAPFERVKPLLVQAIENDAMTDLAFRLDGRILDFPVEMWGPDLRVLERKDQTILWTQGLTPDAVRQVDVRAGPLGALLVEGIRPGGAAAEVEDPLGNPVPPPRPPSPVEEWNSDRLRALFRETPESYVALKVSGKEPTADVLLCLEALKAIAGRRILPQVDR